MYCSAEIVLDFLGTPEEVVAQQSILKVRATGSVEATLPQETRGKALRDSTAAALDRSAVVRAYALSLAG